MGKQCPHSKKSTTVVLGHTHIRYTECDVQEKQKKPKIR